MPAEANLHLDYAGPLQGKMFLVLIDAHSKWMDVFPVHSATTSATLECLRRTFAIHGIAETIVTDNGSCFTSEEFATCMLNNGIQHICVAPYHPASNGMAKRDVSVQTFKQGFTKMKEGTIETRVSRFTLAVVSINSSRSKLSHTTCMLRIVHSESAIQCLRGTLMAKANCFVALSLNRLVDNNTI